MSLSPARKKTMRVATVFTGAAGIVAALAPMQPAQAASVVPMPYNLTARLSARVTSAQLCGYRSESGTGHWTCTPRAHTAVGTGGAHWTDESDLRRGKINLWMWNSHGAEFGATCNTNGSYQGIWFSTKSAFSTTQYWVELEAGGALGGRTSIALSTKWC